MTDDLSVSAPRSSPHPVLRAASVLVLCGALGAVCAPAAPTAAAPAPAGGLSLQGGRVVPDAAPLAARRPRLRPLAGAPRPASSAPAQRLRRPTRTGRPAVPAGARPGGTPTAGPTALAAPAPTTPAAPRPAAPAPTPAPAAPVPAVAAPATSAGRHAFLAEQAPGDPVRWDPCRPVRWTFNPAGAPVGGHDVVRRAVARVAQVSGLRFEELATSDQVPTSDYLAAGGEPPVLIGWSTAAASTLLRDQPPGLVGMTQDAFGRTPDRRTRIASAVVALNRAIVAPTSGPSSWYTFTLHELGHVVGLAHVPDGGELMNAYVPSSLSDFAAGDLAGLRLLGGPCTA